MSNEQELNSLLNDPLDQVETDRPLLEGLAELKLVSTKTTANKAGNGQNLEIKFAIQTQMTARGGRIVQPGFPVFHLISLRQTEKYNPRENLAKLKEALTGSHSGAFGNPEQYIGLVCNAQLKVEQGTDKVTGEAYEPRTVIARFIKKG